MASLSSLTKKLREAFESGYNTHVNNNVNKLSKVLEPIEKKTTRKLIGQPLEALGIAAMSPQQRASYKPIALTKPTLKGQLRDIGEGGASTASLIRLGTPAGIASLVGLETFDAATTVPFNVGRDLVDSVRYRKPSFDYTGKSLKDLASRLPDNMIKAGLYGETNKLSTPILKTLGVKGRVPKALLEGAINVGEDYTTAGAGLTDKPTLKSNLAAFGLPALISGVTGKEVADEFRPILADQTGSFGGINASRFKNLSGEALNKELEKSRAFSNTKDKGLRFFISDKQANLKRQGLKNATDRGFGTLDEIISHPSMFKEYPQARNINVQFDPKMTARGSYDETSNTIKLNPNTTNFDQIGTILHENQHFIQGAEGFAKGSSPALEKQRMLSKLHDLENVRTSYNKLRGELQNLASLGKDDPVKRQLLIDTNNYLMDMGVNIHNRDTLAAFTTGDFGRIAQDIGDDSTSSYLKMMGEVEARAAGNPEFRKITQRQYNDVLNKSKSKYGGQPDLLAEQLKKDGISPDQVITKGGGISASIDPLIEEARKYKSAEEFVKAQSNIAPEYGMSHRPTEGVRAFDLTEKVDGEQMIPKDMYEQWYGSRGTRSDLESIAVLRKIKGNPEAEVTIYRASPKESFNNGDWVSFSKSYAQQHATGNNTKVHSKVVKAKDVRWAMDDINEFGYYPEKQASLAIKEAQLKELGADLTDMEQYGDPGVFPNYEIFSKQYDQLKSEIDITKSQLTDIWNQAKGSAISESRQVTKSTGGLGDNSRLDTRGKYRAELDSSPVSPQIQPTKMPISKQSSTQSFDKSLAEIEKTVYGSATPSQAELGGTKDNAGFLTDILRRGQAGVSSKVGSLTESPKSAVRNIGRLLEGFGGGLGKTQTQVEAKGVFGGGKDYAAKIGGDVQKHVNNVLGNSKESAARVWEILDPELSKTKLTYEDLTPQEKEATDFLRQVSDFINDTNHKNGFISDELWKKNKGGKYIARAYEAFDLPPEVADFVKQSQAKFDLNPFKQRTEVNDWKEANAMRDPAYLVGKRLQQTLFNDSISKMSASMMKTGLVSDVAKPGYVQVSDHKAYGEMAGKWVRKDALEDIKGFFYESDVAQKAYDLISWYDRNPVRKTYKKLFTVFNPAVRLGNKTGNYVFAWMSGINPATFAKNQMAAKGEVKNSGPLFRRALKDGLVGTDITKADITQMAVELKSGIQDKNILRKIDETLQNRYGETDDIAKVAALKTFLDRGYTYEEAARRVYNGFQNYRTVGWLYDVGSKIPVLGNPFVRFKADFGRILKNAVIEHPFRLASTVIAYQLFTDVMSRMSGETTVDKETRENRFGSPRIPFTQTSLAVQTPFGEINAARLLGAYGTNLGENDMAGDISDYSPIKNPLNARNYGTDPVVGPVISTAMDKDFRGKSIKDPNQSKYTGSLLTPNEQRANQGKFLLRSYTPTVLNSGADLVSAVRGNTDFYGRTKTPTQAALRVYPGVKLEQFGAKEAEAQRAKDKQFEEYKREDIKSKTKTINKQLSEGKITYKQAEARKQALKDGVKAKVSFEKSEDSPRNIAEKTALYGKALQTDPSGAIKGMFTEERARKMRGDALIFERKNNLNTGGTDMELDHTASLGLGGDNSADNLVYYPHDIKVKKDALEKKLIKQLEDGEIKEKEAQAIIKAWTADNPTTAKEPTNTGKDKEYKIKTKTGKTVKIDIDSPIVKPKLSGLKELDKGLVSKYNSSITTRINNIQKVYADGQIKADKANADIKKLLESKIDTSKPKKAKKRSGVRISLPKSKTYKIKGLSKLSSRINSKPVKFKKLKLAKLKFAKAKPIKFNRKVAVKKKPIKFKNTLSGNLTRLT